MEWIYNVSHGPWETNGDINAGGVRSKTPEEKNRDGLFNSDGGSSW